jgi:hypothetical protein
MMSCLGPTGKYLKIYNLLDSVLYILFLSRIGLSKPTNSKFITVISLKKIVWLTVLLIEIRVIDDSLSNLRIRMSRI